MISKKMSSPKTASSLLVDEGELKKMFDGYSQQIGEKGEKLSYSQYTL